MRIANRLLYFLLCKKASFLVQKRSFFVGQLASNSK